MHFLLKQCLLFVVGFPNVLEIVFSTYWYGFYANDLASGYEIFWVAFFYVEVVSWIYLKKGRMIILTIYAMVLCAFLHLSGYGMYGATFT